MEKAKQEYQAYVSDYFRRGAMREMDENERGTIIDGLFQSFILLKNYSFFKKLRFKETMGRCSS